MEKWVVVEEDQIETTWSCPSCKKINPGLTGTESESLRCVNCGYLKTTADRYVLPADVEAAPAVTGIAAERARRGENFDCTYCGHSLRARTQRCENCGASVGAASVSTPFQPPPPTPLKAPSPPTPLKAPPPPSTRPRVTGAKAVGASAPPPTSVYRTNARSYDSFEPPPRRTPNFFAWGAGLFAILFLCGVGWGIHQLTQPHKTVVRVVGGTWTRTVTAYARQTYTDHGWRDTLHEETGTREQIVIGSCEERQDGTRNCEPSWPCNPAQVPDEASPRCTGGNLENYNCRNVTVNVPGTCRDVPQTNSPRCFTRVRDNGNGGARRQRVCPTEEVCDTRSEQQCDTRRTPRVCPMKTVYRSTCWTQCPRWRTWCAYTADRWVSVPGAQMSGTLTSRPQWPWVEPATANRRIYFAEAYQIFVRDEDDRDQQWTLTPRTEYEFATYVPGARYSATYTLAGSITLYGRVP